MLLTTPRRLCRSDWISLLLLGSALSLAAAISSGPVVIPSAQERSKLSYTDYLFVSALSSKKFEDDDTMLKAYSSFQVGSNKSRLRRSKENLLTEIRDHEKTHPLTRLVLVSKFLEEPISDFDSLSKLADKQDLERALKVRSELSAETSTKQLLSKNEIETVFPDAMMRQAFLIRAEHTSKEERLKAHQALKAKCAEIKKIEDTTLLIDGLHILIGLICLIPFARRLMKKKTTELDEIPISYPKPRAIEYTIFSLIFAVLACAGVYAFVELALKSVLPEVVVRGLGLIIFPPLTVLVLYEFSIRQQGLSFAEGFRLRWSNPQEKGREFLSAYTNFCILYFITIALALLSVMFPSSIPETSNASDVFNAINRSTLVPLILSVTVLGPIAEECLFRGYLYSSLRTKLGCIPAGILSAALFSAAHMHFNPYMAGHHFLLGIFTVYLFQKTKSIIPGILLHSLWNISAVFSILSGVASVYPLQRLFF